MSPSDQRIAAREDAYLSANARNLALFNSADIEHVPNDGDALYSIKRRQQLRTLARRIRDAS
jgi:hypothetical protein